MTMGNGQKIPETLTRLLTAVVLLPALAIVYYGGMIAVILFLLVTIMMAAEAIRVRGMNIASLYGVVAIAAVILPAINLAMGTLASPLVSVIAAAAVLIGINLSRNSSWISAVILLTLMLTCYSFVGLTLAESQHWLLLLVATVIAADTSAFFGGRFFGGPKLAPMISPSKTWSGAIAGLIGGGLLAAVIAPSLGISLQSGVIMGILIADFSIGGDLLESWFKRHHSVKDSGCILPGHGGLLDRCDGYLLSAPLVYCVVILGGING